MKEKEENAKKLDEVDHSLPKDEFTDEDFNNFWNEYLNSIQNANKPAYNVLQTVKWHFKAKNQIEFTFDSQAMIVEFDKLRENFLKKLRTTLNNFSIVVETVVSKTEVKTNYVKTRKDIYNDLVKINPDIEYLKEKLGLDIENEPNLK